MTDKIIRHRASGYIALPGDILFDKEVNAKCRGIYLTVMALPEEWDFSVQGLTRILPDGEDAIRSALKALSQRGWLSYHRARNEKGQVTGTEWHFFDQRQDENPYRENPYMENPDGENPNGENPAQFKYQLSNIPINTHTHTADGSPSGEEEKKHSDEEQRVIDSVQKYIHDKCSDLELRFEPLKDEQIIYLHYRLNIGLQDIVKYLKDIQAKQLNYMVGASLCRLIEKFRENDFTLRRKKK